MNKEKEVSIDINTAIKTVEIAAIAFASRGTALDVGMALSDVAVLMREYSQLTQEIVSSLRGLIDSGEAMAGAARNAINKANHLQNGGNS